jgi:hypothetical protein
MSLEGLASIPLRLPDLVFVRTVHPEEEFFLSTLRLPTTAINYAPYGDSVYIVSDLKDPSGKTYRGVRQEAVKLKGSRGDQVAV